MLNLTAKDIEKLRAGKVVNKYNDLTGKVSFNVRDYSPRLGILKKGVKSPFLN